MQLAHNKNDADSGASLRGATSDMGVGQGAFGSRAGESSRRVPPSIVRSTAPSVLTAIMTFALTIMMPLALTACSTERGVVPGPTPIDTDPIDQIPVARFATPVGVDDMAQCIGEQWARLSTIGPGKVTLHPSLRGLIVDVKAPTDPLARSYVEIYQGVANTRIDYFVRSFVSDPNENLRLRALQGCL